ncbi:hypothetical protein N0V83_010240 [Neocucurbitaria cava]|uniref:Uncharacterized protein n=1 Tax=Neocucurbitaria cava TaxID=798079 RepID=A0A9W8XZG4_9PLEO|nr:hypothetical protein N0V83_010240 [Neocucurbitaria cava]
MPALRGPGNSRTLPDTLTLTAIIPPPPSPIANLLSVAISSVRRSISKREKLRATNEPGVSYQEEELRYEKHANALIAATDASSKLVMREEFVDAEQRREWEVAVMEFRGEFEQMRVPEDIDMGGIHARLREIADEIEGRGKEGDGGLEQESDAKKEEEDGVRAPGEIQDDED